MASKSSRREFLRLAGVVASIPVLEACTARTSTLTTAMGFGS